MHSFFFNPISVLRVLGTSNTSIIGEFFKLFEETKSTSVRFWAGWNLGIFTYDPKVVEILLTNEHCLNKPYVYEQLHCNSSLLVVDKESWRIRRRALNSAFSATALQAYVPLLNEKTRILIDRIEPFVNQRCDAYKSIFIGMVDTVTRTLMGVDMDLQSEKGASLYTVIKEIMNSVMYRIVRIWLQYDFIYYNLSKIGRMERNLLKAGNDFVDEIYDKRVDELKEQHSPSTVDRSHVNNILDKCLLLERTGTFSHEHVLDHMRVTIVAGIDTSSIAVFGTLLMLAMNQKHQELVADELRSIFETADCEIDQSHLAAMSYTERVLKETMRLLSPIPFFARQLTDNVEFPHGTVPSGTMVIVSILNMHRNPEIWGENVMEFEPDRFLPENIAKRPAFSYIPFSAGAR